jgi:hypothetical protein
MFSTRRTIPTICIIFREKKSSRLEECVFLTYLLDISFLAGVFRILV